MEHEIFVSVDLLGTLVFALSGAFAAEEKRLDLFGAFAVAHITATGGGIFRDLCLGALPPAGISDWRYLACSAIAVAATFGARRTVTRLRHPVLFFDSLGLGFFAVVGAHKALAHGGNIEVAVLLGTATAIGGGAIRDVLLNRVPVILTKEIYAVAAMVGAAVQVVGEQLAWAITVMPWFGAAICLVLRLLSVHYSWSLPVLARKQSK